MWKCIFCGRVAEGFAGSLSYPEPAFLEEEDFAPLCHECALSAYYQGGLYWTSDIYRILGYWPEQMKESQRML